MRCAPTRAKPRGWCILSLRLTDNLSFVLVRWNPKGSQPKGEMRSCWIEVENRFQRARLCYFGLLSMSYGWISIVCVTWIMAVIERHDIQTFDFLSYLSKCKYLHSPVVLTHVSLNARSKKDSEGTNNRLNISEITGSMFWLLLRLWWWQCSILTEGPSGTKLRVNEVLLYRLEKYGILAYIPGWTSIPAQWTWW